MISKIPVLYCDIDGTIRMGKDELGYFVNTANQVKVFPEVPDLLWGYKRLGWRIIGVSNQGGIALGHMDLSNCYMAFHETEKQTRYAFDKLLFCPHAPDAGCECRKPKPGMIIRARDWLIERYPGVYPMDIGLFVGDRPEDQQCAENAGLLFLDAAEWRKGDHLKKLLDDATQKEKK